MDVKSALVNSVDQATANRVEEVSARSARERDLAKVTQLSKDFEAIFLEQMLKTMRSSIQKSGLVDGGNAEEIYRSMLDNEYAKLMSAQGSSGLSQMIERQLLQTMGVKSEASPQVTKKNALHSYERVGSATLRPERKEVTIKPDAAGISGLK